MVKLNLKRELSVANPSQSNYIIITVKIKTFAQNYYLIQKSFLPRKKK